MDLMAIISSIGTLILIMLLGLISRKTNILASNDKKVFSSYIYYFALPALFFVEIAKTDFYSLEKSVFIGSVLPIVIVVFLLFVMKLLRMISKDTFIVMGVCTCFGSNAFFGIAFFESLWGEWGFHLSVVTASLLGMLGIVGAVLFFEYATHKGDALRACIKVCKSPSILSIVGGVLCSLLSIHIDFLFQPMHIIGKTAGGCAIFLLGMFIYDNFSFTMIKRSIFLSMGRTILLPCVMLLLLLFMPHMSVKIKQFLLLQTGIPAAISVAVFADKYNYRQTDFTSIVIVTSLMSLIVLGVLYLLSQLVV